MEHLSDILSSQKISMCMWGCAPQVGRVSNTIATTAYRTTGYEVLDHIRINFQDILALLSIGSADQYIRTFMPLILSILLVSYAIMDRKRNNTYHMPDRAHIKIVSSGVRRPVTRSMTRTNVTS